jgi:hypothetical protein
MIAAILAPAIASPRILAQAGSSSSQSAATSAAKTGTATASQKLDINSASKEELEALPGIGEAYAQKIIANRPYRTKRDLVAKKIIPQSTYDKIQDRITAHQTTGSTAKPSGKCPGIRSQDPVAKSPESWRDFGVSHGGFPHPDLDTAAISTQFRKAVHQRCASFVHGDFDAPVENPQSSA